MTLALLAALGLQPVGEIADRYAREHARLDPVWATYMGIHEHNDRLTRYDDASFDARRRLMEATLAELATLDGDALSPDDRLDRDSMRAGVEWELAAPDPRRTDPGLVLDALEVLFTMEIKEYAPAEARALDARARLAQLPAVVYDLRAKLDRPPRIVTEAVIGDLDAGIEFAESLGEGDVPRHAAQALRDYQAFLRDEVLPRSDGELSIGRARLVQLLRDTWGMDDGVDAIFEWLQGEIVRLEAAMEETAHEINPEALVDDLLDQIAGDAPPVEQVLETYRTELRAWRGVLEHGGLFGELPDDPIVLLRTPEFLHRGVSFAACEPDGLYAPGRTSHFYVTIDPEALDLHARAGIRATVLHETLPGHHLQTAYLRRLPTRARGLFEPAIAVEGWATYCEFVAAEEELLEPVQRLSFLDDQRANAEAAWAVLALHGRLVPREEVVTWARELDEDLASYVEDPGYWAAYTLGAWEYRKLRAATKDRLGEGFSLPEFHRRVLGYGPIPPSRVRRELEREWD